ATCLERVRRKADTTDERLKADTTDERLKADTTDERLKADTTDERVGRPFQGRLRIGIDISRSLGEATGVGIYASSLVDALAEIDPDNDYVLYPYFWDCFPPDFRIARAPARPNFRLRTENAPIEKIQQRWMSQPADAAA